MRLNYSQFNPKNVVFTGTAEITNSAFRPCTSEGRFHHTSNPLSGELLLGQFAESSPIHSPGVDIRTFSHYCLTSSSEITANSALLLFHNSFPRPMRPALPPLFE